MSATEDKFSVSLPLLYVTWETERPLKQRTRRSPVFFFKNYEWYLELRVLDGICDTSFNLFMILSKEIQFLTKFTVKTYFLDPLQQKPFHSGLNTFTCFKGSLWIAGICVSDVEKCIPSFKKEGILMIECLFEEVDSAIQSLQSGGTPAVYFPLKTESPLSSKVSPVCSTSAIENQPYGLENLSKDLVAMLDNKVLPDMQLMVDETSIPCHKSVLVARSKVFAAMFQHEMTESTSGVLKIKDIDLSTTEAFLKYLYSGKISDDLTEDILMKLFEAGDKYDVHALKRESSKKLTKYINEENYLSYLSLAEALSDHEFKEAVVCYIVKKDKLLKSENWMQFSAENPKLAVEVYRKYVAK